MRKRIVYAGLALLIIAVAAFLILQSSAGSFVTNSIGRSVTTANLTTNVRNYSFVPISVGSNSSLVIIYAISLSPENFYIFNATGFSSFESYMRSNGTGGLNYVMAHATALLGENVNSSDAILTSNLNGTQANQTVRNLSTFNPGPVYFVIDNSNGSISSNSPVVSRVEYFAPTPSQLTAYGSTSWNFALEGSVVLLLGIAGIALLVYGFIKKSPEEKEMPAKQKGKDDGSSKEYIDALYKNVNKRGKKAAD